MKRLARRDLQTLVSCLPEFYACSDLEGFAPRVIAALPKVISFDSISYTEFDPLSFRTLTLVTDPPPSEYAPEAAQVLERHMHEHPLVNHYQETRDGRACKVSGFLTRCQWHRLGLYNEFYKEIKGVEYQMAINISPSASALAGLALDRGGRKDFSERDRLVLDMLRPHLVQAYQNAQAVTRARRGSEYLRQELESSERGEMGLSEKTQVVWCTEQARRWVEQYFGPARRAERLPERLRRWVEHQRSLLSGAVGGAPPPRTPLVVQQAGKRLEVRLVDDELEEGIYRLVLEERCVPLSVESLESVGLTNREAEILHHAARGKTNKEISKTLYISPLTVKKHLEHVYEKLGAQSRTKALSRALEILDTYPGT